MNNVERDIKEKFKAFKKEHDECLEDLRIRKNYLFSQQFILTQCDTIEKIDESIMLLMKKKDQMTKIYLQ